MILSLMAAFLPCRNVRGPPAAGFRLNSVVKLSLQKFKGLFHTCPVKLFENRKSICNINKLNRFMVCIDFRTPVDFTHLFHLYRERKADIHGTDYFPAVDGVLAKTRIQQMRPALSGQPQGTGLLLPRSISTDGVRTDHLPESLRDSERCFRARKAKLYHAAIRGKISRSTLADANEKRDWRIYDGVLGRSRQERFRP